MGEAEVEIDRAGLLVSNDVGRGQEDLEVARGAMSGQGDDSREQRDDGKTCWHGGLLLVIRPP